MNKVRSWDKLASIYIGTIIGAGFASGQEIIQFFGVFGYRGIFGIILATILFSIIGTVVLLKVYKDRLKGYEELIIPIFGEKLGRVIEIIITLFLFLGFCIMLAGSGAIFHQQFGFSYNIGIYIMAALALITFVFSVKGISIVNTLLVPLLLVGIITIGIIVILKEGFIFSNFDGIRIAATGNWITSAILYVSYNSISAIVIMTSLFSIISNERDAIKGGILGGLGLGLLALFIMIPTLILYTDIYTLEIPMLKIAEHIGTKGRFIYSFILWCAMFTTAIASGFGCIRRISKLTKLNHNLVALVFSFITMPFAKLGFSNLVITLYPFFGYMGLFMLLYIFGNFLSKRIKSLF